MTLNLTVTLNLNLIKKSYPNPDPKFKTGGYMQIFYLDCE